MKYYYITIMNFDMSKIRRETMKKLSGLLILIGLTACTSVKSGTGSENTKVGMPNPASKYCVEQGGKSEIRKAENGGSYGVCIFKDGSEEDEWEYFRKNNAK